MGADRDRLARFVGLERAVWDALVRGDPAADRAALAPGFVGVYPSGFAGAEDHFAQLADGPTVADYVIADARILDVAAGHVMLSYLATYRRRGAEHTEQMYVSSLWSETDGAWLNVFSQDTPVGAPGSVV